MLHQPIRKPFGDDEDANRAIGSVLSIVGHLSVESRKLVQTNWRDMQAQHRQEVLVAELRSRIVSRARSVFQDPDRFLEEARALLEVKTKRKIVIHSLGDTPAADDDLLRLEGELLDAEIHEQAMTRRLTKSRENFANAKSATAATRRAIEARRLHLGRAST